MATESDTPNTAALSTIIVVGALAMVAIIAAITALVRSTEGSRRAKVDSAANLQAYRELVASQRAPLMAPPAWVDQSKGLVSIPIRRAETQEIKDIRANPWAASPGVRDAGTDAADAGAPTTQAEAGAPAKNNAGAKAGGSAKTKTPAPQKSGATTPKPHKQPAPTTGAAGRAAPTGSAKAPATEHSP